MHATFGRFPATVPPIHLLMYLQAHRLDTDFYDTHFQPGAYLRTTPRTTRAGPPEVDSCAPGLPDVQTRKW